jgi:hypothetical protein
MTTSDVLALMNRGVIGRHEMAQLVDLIWSGSGFSRWEVRHGIAD